MQWVIDILTNIGEWVIGLFSGVNVQEFVSTLSIMGEGMIGIFAGTVVMIVAMITLNKFCK